MLTAEILHNTDEQPYYLLSDAELEDKWVSSLSRWHSPRWQLDNPSHGQSLSGSAISWEVMLSDGLRLTDPPYAQMLDWLRRVVWSLSAAPGDGAPPISPGTMGGISSSLRKIVPWLVANGIRWPHQLTQTVLDQFVDELPERLANEHDEVEQQGDDESGPSLAVVVVTLTTFIYVWRQRHCLEEAGIKPMPSKPWPELKGVLTLAGKVTSQARGWIQPLPDEVAVPLVNQAIWFLGTPGKDILRLQSELEHARRHWLRPQSVRSPRPGPTGGYQRRQRNVAKSFRFSTLESEERPWHKNLAECVRPNGLPGPIFRARQLIAGLQTACILVVQSLTGLRASDLCGLESGTDPSTGLPTGVSIRRSSTGLNEEFILCSETSKGRTGPELTTWLLGSRRVGDRELPEPVRALLILNKLLAPYRKLFGTNKLLVGVSSHLGLPKTRRSVTRMTTNRIQTMYATFMNEWVDLTRLPDQSLHATSQNDLVPWRESKGTVITTHQLRKTFALYVLSVHPDLLPAVKRQFSHINMAITESGYWGSNAPQIEPIHSVSRQMTARMLFEVIEGRSILSGKMGKKISQHIDDLRAQVASMCMNAAWRHIYLWVEANEVKANHSAHGSCIPILPSRMECWKRVRQRPYGELDPNYATREATLCAGCSCFAMDARHVPFWRDRYVEHKVALLVGNSGRSDAPNFRMIKIRAEQARKILLDVGQNVDELDSLVYDRMSTNAIEA